MGMEQIKYKLLPGWVLKHHGMKVHGRSLQPGSWTIKKQALEDRQTAEATILGEGKRELPWEEEEAADSEAGEGEEEAADSEAGDAEEELSSSHLPDTSI